MVSHRFHLIAIKCNIYLFIALYSVVGPSELINLFISALKKVVLHFIAITLSTQAMYYDV